MFVQIDLHPVLYYGYDILHALGAVEIVSGFLLDDREQGTCLVRNESGL